MIHQNIKTLLRSLTNAKMRLRFRKAERHVKQFVMHAPVTTMDQMRDILKDLGLNKGDRIIVSSSFGHINANFKPSELISLLQEAVGEEGLIMMPYYPPMNSTEWAAKQQQFDMRNTKSGMGILTNVFSKMSGVYMSKHPTKAVCAWGKGAEEIVKDHDLATTPFYWDSPYGRLLAMGSKSLGLGLKNIPIFHTFEDVLSASPFDYYQEKSYSLHLIDKDGNNQLITTRVHNLSVLDRCLPAGDYVRALKCKAYKRINVGSAFVYIIDNNDLDKRCKGECAKGHSRITN